MGNIFRYNHQILISLILVCMCLAILMLIDIYGQLDIHLLVNNSSFGFALLSQLFALFGAFYCWRILINYSTPLKISMGESLSHIGFTSIGKYLPGKVWGLAARIFILKKYALPSNKIVNLILVDQILLLYSGISIGIVFLGLTYSYWIGIVAGIIALISLPIFRYLYGSSWTYLLAMIRKLSKKLWPQEKEFILEPVTSKLFYSVFAICCLQWLLWGVALVALFYPLIQNQLVLNSFLIIAAVPLAVILGSLVVWIPSGLGVREGGLIIILSQLMPLELATTIAITFRAWCIIVDIALGGTAMIYLYFRRDLWLLLMQNRNHTGDKHKEKD